MALALHNYKGRTGYYQQQPSGYRAFVPAPIPFDPPLDMNLELLSLLSRADQAVGRLDAASDILPNPDLFVGMYVRKEALLSSQIEGVTQASLAELLEFEAKSRRGSHRADIAEVVNYINAMNYGLERLNELPMSNRLVREIHNRLLRNVRGQERHPGSFRVRQNWIGPPGCDIGEAIFVPPPPREMEEAMRGLERFLHDQSPLPVLIKAGLIHCQFETIHPFLDGNGRMGRLLIVFYLCEKGVLRRPLLYLSAFFRKYRDEYYDRLQRVRDYGDIEGWMTFFLTAVSTVCEAAARTSREILLMREKHRALMGRESSMSSRGGELLAYLFRSPYVTVTDAAGWLGVSFPTANGLVDALVNHGILDEITGQRRNRHFRYTEYLDLMDRELEFVPSG